MNCLRSLLRLSTVSTLIMLPTSGMAASITTLATFTGANGAFPFGGLYADAQGNLFGTTRKGLFGGGTVFKIDAETETLTTLVGFFSVSGKYPYGSLIADAAGNLYGTTAAGGTTYSQTNNGNGTVFEIVPGQVLPTILVNFNGTNGAHPFAGLIFDSSGNLYGTTVDGGANGYGTVFKVAATTHEETLLYSFSGTDGGHPWGGLWFDSSGNLYGTTNSGGANDDGTIFEIAAGTHTLTTLHSFNGADGQHPTAGLVVDSQGNLYGTTNGGPSSGGTVFEYSPSTQTLTTLYSFTGGANGIGPYAGLLVDAAGNLFDTAREAGAYGYGTVFRIESGTHQFTKLLDFDGFNGAFPMGTLIADHAGNLYGTTSSGRLLVSGVPAFDGTVFKLTDTGFVVPEINSSTLFGIAAVGLVGYRAIVAFRQVR